MNDTWGWEEMEIVETIMQGIPLRKQNKPNLLCRRWMHGPFQIKLIGLLLEQGGHNSCKELPISKTAGKLI